MEHIRPFIKTPWRMAGTGCGFLALICVCCVGISAVLPDTSSDIGGAVSTDNPALQLSTATNTPPGIPSPLMTATFTAIPATFVPTTAPPTLLSTALPVLPTVTSAPTTIPPTAVPPTLVPTAIPTNPPPPTNPPAIACVDRNCPSFGSCREVLDFLAACPQYWSDLDGNGDGVPCQDLC